jgi:iron complex outermembrane receptor protein
MTAVAVPSPSAPNTTLYSYVVNGGEQDHQGVEGLVRFILKQSNAGFFKLVRPFANLTYSDFKYGDNFTIEKSPVVTEDYSNKDVAAVPKFVANLGLDLLMNYGLYANIVYNHKEKMPITSVNDLYAIGYNLLNGKIGMQRNLGKHFDLDVYCGATNITNSKYYIMVFANQLPDAYIPAAKNANVYGGANLKYTF